MEVPPTIDKSRNNIYQQYVNDYIRDFKVRSHGYELPEIEFYGKILNKNTLKGGHDSIAKIFVAIPIKNQDKIIEKVLGCLFKSSNQILQIGLLFDACEDKSLQVCENYLLENLHKYPNIEKVYMIKSKGDLFESTCENILNKFCEQDFFVSLQADIFFKDLTFFERALDYFKRQPELIGVSGRAVVPFRIADGKSQILARMLNLINLRYVISIVFKKYKKLGFYVSGLPYFGDKSFMPNQPMKFTRKEFNKIYMGDAIIRGPIIWRNKIFRQLNGYNDVSYFLGRDDCDLCFRAKKYDFKVGYVPTTSYSIPENGTTRNARSVEAEKYYQSRYILAASNPGELNNFWNKKRSLFSS